MQNQYLELDPKILKFGFLWGCIFVTTLVIGSLLLDVAYPYPDIAEDVPVIGPKLRYFADHKDEYDVVFLGPSTTYRGIAPRLFDQVLGEQGHPLKSFNLGVGSLYVPELDFYLKKILALNPANLKWVFIDYPNNLQDTTKGNTRSLRNIYWHTPQQTLLAARAVLASADNIQYKLETVYSHIKSCFIHIFRVGELGRFWNGKVLKLEISGLKSDHDRNDLSIQEQGFYSLDWEGQNKQALHQEWLDNIDVYNQKLESWQNGPNETYFSPFIYHHAQSLLKKTKKQGIQGVLLIPPVLYDVNTIKKLYENQDIPLLFAFNDPKAFMELYRPEFKFNDGHLNTKGAEAFTYSLAILFADYLETGKEGLYGYFFVRDDQNS
jgi:cellobiose-specific phosphotransferase system component IIB